MFTATEWGQGLVIIAMFTIVIAIPCFAVGVLGTKLINYIGQYPSKSAKKQTATCIKLVILEVISFVLLACIFLFFS